MNNVASPNSTEPIRPQSSRTQSYERRGRSTSVRPSNHNDQEQPEQTYQFRPPEVVKNIQRVPSTRNTSFEKSRSRETSTVRKDHLPNVNESCEMNRSSSAASMNYRVSRLPSNLNPNTSVAGNAPPHINNRYRHPMSAYNSNEAVDTIVPNHSNILYQKYQKPPISSKPSNESKASLLQQYQTPRSNISVSMDQDLIPAFNDLTMELGEAMNDHIEKNVGTFKVDNSYIDSKPNSTKSDGNSESSSLLNGLSSSPEEPILKSSVSEATEDQKKDQKFPPKQVEKFGRIQQRVNFLKRMKDEESNSIWKSLSVEQKTFFESLNNDLRNLKRSNYKPFRDSLERTYAIAFEDKQVFDSSASVTSKQYLLKTYNPLKESKPHFTQQKQITKPTKEIDINKLKNLLPHSIRVAETMWKTEEEHRNSQITLKSENKSSADTVSSLNSDSLSVKLVTHTYEPKDLDAIKESFDGYEISTSTASHNDTGDAVTLNRANDSKQPSPLTQRVQ